MQRADQYDPLSGLVRVNHMKYGYSYYQDAQQPLLIGGAFNEPDELQHVKIKQPDPAHVNPQSRRIAKSGVQAFVDEHTKGLNVSVSAPIAPRHPHLYHIEKKVTSWLNDTFHGIGAKHLQAYLDEYCFRLNLDFRQIPIVGQLLQWCAITPTLIYDELTRDKPVLAVPWHAWGSKAKWKGNYLSLWNAG
ncbi:hypothetical protein D3H35_04735 [Cohnella faecalis]|uniref:Uncharacterized protein n=2 Tax=Cohnella faecalis TaxID=2315694 RepID=A0A398CQG2_9BACL|nr:hypothetical protein D3H35_04735 [Cohnella faecalis]